jgi:biopolymer transport protein ExbD
MSRGARGPRRSGRNDGGSEARRVEANQELDLIPVLSLVVHLIPMLLLAVRFVTLAEHDMGQPPREARDAPSRQKLDEQESERVIVRIGPEGFSVRGASEGETLLPCAALPCTAENYDQRGLRAALAAAHDRNPGQRSVLVVPEPAVPYRAIVTVFDAARGGGDLGPALFSDPVLVRGAKAGEAGGTP